MKIEGFAQMLEQIHKDRGIAKETLIEAIEAALLSACKKRVKHIENLEAKIDESGVAYVFAKKTVVKDPKDVKDESLEISLKDAKKIDKNAKKGDEIKIDVTPSDFGRFAAQTAKQVIIQRIREAEKETAFNEFNNKIGDIVTGVIQRKERNGYLINLGKIETLLSSSEHIPRELYRPKDHIKLYVVDVKKTPKGPLVVVSRTHSGLVKKLFELEVPEISQGVLEIKALAREPGRRSKVAVYSKDKNVSAVGTCVGHMGVRIQNIVRELGSERIDIIEWSEKPEQFLANALSPAKVSNVKINEKEHTATVAVPENQLSLAIGKEGQNVRLAAKLTGWKIDISSEEEAEKKEPETKIKVKSETKKEKKTEETKEVKPKGEEDRIKVHKVAKELGKKSKEVIEILKEMGIEAKGPTSSISLEDKNKLIEKIKS